MKDLTKLAIKVIKFQIYFAEELLVKTHERFNHFKNQSFSEREWINILNFSKKKKFKIYVDVFGIKALKLSKSICVYGFKIHGSDLCNSEIL